MIGVSLEEAIRLLLDHTTLITDQEEVPVCEAGGRILKEAIYAPFSQPPFDRSPLDGYAFKSEDSMGASKEAPVLLKVIGQVDAGGVYEGTVKKGEAVRIMTGAPIPAGCDCVLRQEATDYGEETVAIYESLKPYSNYCYKGEDIKEGSLILKKGEKLSAITQGVLASMGFEKVKVIRRLKMGLICTGDELTVPGQPLRPGKIYNSNGVMLEARARELGFEVLRMEQCEDTASQVAEAIGALKDQVDFVVTTGGVSVGKKDIMHDVFKLLNVNRLFWRINIQPGTPVLAGVLEDKLFIGLSGNPFASLVNFELLVREVAAKMQQDPTCKPLQVKAVMASDFNKASKKRRFIRASYSFGQVALNHTNHASGSLYTMSLCNALIDIPKGTECLRVGDEVAVILL